MSQPGFAVLLKSIFGRNQAGVQALLDAIEQKKVIQRVWFNDTNAAFNLHFADDSKLSFADAGQSCCESRYMTVDGDDLTWVEGATFVGAKLKEAPNETHDWGEHEVQFLEIQTSKGVMTISNHNEHNGYYGGFCVEARPYAL